MIQYQHFSRYVLTFPAYVRTNRLACRTRESYPFLSRPNPFSIAIVLRTGILFYYRRSFCILLKIFLLVNPIPIHPHSPNHPPFHRIKLTRQTSFYFFLRYRRFFSHLFTLIHRSFYFRLFFFFSFLSSFVFFFFSFCY